MLTLKGMMTVVMENDIDDEVLLEYFPDEDSDSQVDLATKRARHRQYPEFYIETDLNS